MADRTITLSYEQGRALEKLLREVLATDEDLADPEMGEQECQAQDALADILPDGVDRRYLEQLHDELRKPAERTVQCSP